MTAVAVAGRGNIPVDATGVVLNIAAVVPDRVGYLTVFDCDADVPMASNVNYGSGGVRSNLVFTPLSDDGQVCIYSLGSSDLVVDVEGVMGAADTTTSGDQASERHFHHDRCADDHDGARDDSPTDHDDGARDDSPTDHDDGARDDSPTDHDDGARDDSPTDHDDGARDDSPTDHDDGARDDSPTHHDHYQHHDADDHYHVHHHDHHHRVSAGDDGGAAAGGWGFCASGCVC